MKFPAHMLFSKKRFTEAFENTDKIYSFLDSGVISLGRFFSGIALAKLSGADAFAEYILLTTLLFFVHSIPASLRIIPMVNLTTGRPRAEQWPLIRWSRRQARYSLASIALLGIAGFPIAVGKGIDPWVYSGFALSTIVGIELLFQRAQAQTLFRMKAAFMADATGLLLHFAGILLCVILGGSPMIGYWWGLAVSSIYSVVRISRTVERSGSTAQDRESKEKTGSAIAQARYDGRSILVGSLSNSACSRLAPFVLKSVGGLLAVANFGVVWTLLGPLRMVSAAISSILRPRFALYVNTFDEAGFDKLFNRTLIGVAAMGSACSAAAVYVAPYLIEVLFDPSLREAGLMLPLAMAYATFDVLTTTQMIAMQTRVKKGAKIAAKLRMASAIVSVALIFPLTQFYGAMGAYVALLASELVYFAAARQIVGSGEARYSKFRSVSP